jgi:serine/threonine-protein kinase
LDATSAIARQAYSVLLVSQRRGDEAVAQLKVAMELEPSSHRTQDFYADFLFLSRRYDEAVAQFKTVVAMKPDKISTYQWFVRTLEAQGNEAEAYEWFMKSLVAGKQSEEMIQKFRTAYETSGYRGVLLERIATVDKEIGFRKAGAYARLGDKDKAFEVLEQMYQKRVWSIAVLVPVDPQLDPIRDDPRYDDLIRRIEGK